ncbi:MULTISPECIES: ABC transporter permease [Jeotgalicoccus]|uniref:ABC transporter permease n=1 Tax=Jeotgalicoccus TaxID=227979 RepID=UPI000402C2B6|nr:MULTISPECIES: ABC transporter permease [Jeotgalicoccus]QQD85836.1 ABC transporter permease [Jeotgalicoccus sp. ATCC 8456]
MKKLLLIPYALWMLIFVVFPLLLMAAYSFIDLSGNITLNNYASFFSSNYIQMTLSSFWYAFLITLFTLIVSYPLALALNATKRKTIWLLIIILPTWINLLLKTYAFIGIFGKNGILNDIFAVFNIDEIQLLFSDTAFIIVSVYIFLPFMLLPLFNAISGIDNNLLNAAKDLGATRVQVFSKIILPLTADGIKAGIQVVFIPSLSLFMITRLITGNKVITLGTAIEQQFLTNENWGMGSTIGIFLVIFMLLIMVITSGKSDNRVMKL